MAWEGEFLSLISKRRKPNVKGRLPQSVRRDVAGGPGSHPGGTHRKKGLVRDGGPDGDVPGNDAEDEGRMLLATQGPE